MWWSGGFDCVLFRLLISDVVWFVFAYCFVVILLLLVCCLHAFLARLSSLCCDFYCLVGYCLHSCGSEFADSGGCEVGLLYCVGLCWLCCHYLLRFGGLLDFFWFVLWWLRVGLLVVCFVLIVALG